MPSPTSLPTNVAANDTGHVGHTNTVHGAVNGLTTVPVVAVLSSRALALSDSASLLAVSATATVTVPTNATVAFPTGTVLSLYRAGAGAVTVAAAAGVTIRQVDSVLTLRAQYSTATLHKVGTDEWVLSGDLG